MTLNIILCAIIVLLFITIVILFVNFLNLKVARNNLLKFIIHHDQAKNNYQDRSLDITIKNKTLIVDVDDFISYSIT
jgi:hypothetical protein